ncbi:ATP12-domain-containing protein [Xylariaceae sp. FL0662B]|nr:ATP12-domain-containing protein [Xylariaceae sp. FL0662B]
MRPPARVALRLAACQRPIAVTTPSIIPLARQCQNQIHSTTTTSATVSPIHGTGPPPEAPVPAADSATSRLSRRRRIAEVLERSRTGGQPQQQESSNEISSSSSLPSSSSSKTKAAAATATKTKTKSPTPTLARKRFWEHVHVRDVDGAWQVHLDARPLRHPNTKDIVRIPASKPLLAHALAVEWDMLVSAQQATQQHLIPLTSLVCRALDIADDDAAAAATSGGGGGGVRADVVRMVMRYLDTDSLLCWAPPSSSEEKGDVLPSLHEVQRRAAEDVVGFLAARVWPGVEIAPVLDGESIVPRAQRPGTRQIVEGWVAGLGAWELAALERGVLAGKSLLGAVRLLVEWSEGFAGVGGKEGMEKKKRFGVEEAARLASIEVDWQTRLWGEVEDTHDVEKEDLRRQLGSVVLLVSGMGGGT